MAGIKKYGDLDDKELSEFLAEIKSDDEDIEEAEASADEKIGNEEAQSMLSELPENTEIEAYYGDDAWRKPRIYTGYRDRLTVLYGPYGKQKAAEGHREAIRKKAKRLKEDRIHIQREAFNQDYIRLSDKIEKHHIKLLISILTQEHTRMVDKYSGYINKRLATLLNPLIPRRIRICRMLYPNSIRICPGFMYKASKEYGGGLTFWATPSIPYYFEQNTEQKVLLENKSGFLLSIDKAISFYHEHLKKRQEKELKYASLIIQKGVYSYFDLLKLNPFWFEILYNELKSQIDKNK
jgi:hypothetical protein